MYDSSPNTSANMTPISGDTLVGGAAQMGSAMITNYGNKELAKYAYDRDVEMWEAANKYNSPLEQMKRLKAAGLNPNLVYGKGAQAQGATQLPKYQAIKKQAPDLSQLGSAIGHYYQVQQQKQGIELAKEQVSGQKIANEQANVELGISKNLAPYSITKGKEASYRMAELRTHTENLNTTEVNKHKIQQANLALITGKVTEQEWSNSLHRYGLTMNDAAYYRMAVSGVLEELLQGLQGKKQIQLPENREQDFNTKLKNQWKK